MADPNAHDRATASNWGGSEVGGRESMDGRFMSGPCHNAPPKSRLSRWEYGGVRLSTPFIDSGILLRLHGMESTRSGVLLCDSMRRKPMMMK